MQTDVITVVFSLLLLHSGQNNTNLKGCCCEVHLPSRQCFQHNVFGCQFSSGEWQLRAAGCYYLLLPDTRHFGDSMTQLHMFTYVRELRHMCHSAIFLWSISYLASYKWWPCLTQHDAFHTLDYFVTRFYVPIYQPVAHPLSPPQITPFQCRFFKPLFFNDRDQLDMFCWQPLLSSYTGPLWRRSNKKKLEGPLDF